MTADVLPLHGARRTAEEEQARLSVKALLARHEMKVEELAERVGITRTTIYKRLSPRTGSGQSFTLGEILAVADVFGVTVDDLTHGRTDHSVLKGVASSDTHRYRKGNGIRSNGKKSVAA